ncbi:ATP-binding protein [Hymenobacter terricola]|uniref:ATP-binding protein n=1 Tax=Hymenobacter terricola TaxID=2819236 RepID=UPI001B313A4C|nr:ATP-binding protein [Hymenobacter terricola]
MAESVADTDQALIGAPITLTDCDREPIHLPGLIQPYGFLLCLDEQTHRVVQASANTRELLGMAAENLLGHGLELLLGPAQLAEVARLWPTLTAAPRLLGVRLDCLAGQPFYKLLLHRHDGLLWVEGEAVGSTTVSAFDLPALNLTLGRLLAADTMLDLCQGVAEQVRDLTGFDRVAVYRFADDDSGHVVAEALRPDLAPWLGLHYPATDIPRQARALYLKNWLRFIADVAYAPVPLVPALNPASGRPPDMTYAVLRSVSPIHLQYLRNMGSAATMTISLIQEGRLWGMITCHHETPRLVSYELRDLCQFLGKAASTLLQTKEQQDAKAARQRIQQTQAQLLARIKSPATFVADLYQHRPTVADVFDCGGAAVCLGGEIVCLGQTPTPAQITDLVAWLRRHNTQEVFATNSYAPLNPAGAALRATASGILAVALDADLGEYILWFRPEQAQTVTWAGRHEKMPTVVDGQVFLSPRQSFEAWKQLVEHTATPWTAPEREAAQEIRQHLADMRLKAFHELQAKAVTLARLNLELERSNEELDSFAYVASHDLKEPLRGIHNYAVFLLEDYAAQLDAEGVSKLETLVRLSQRMEGLIEGLLQLSRVGRLDVVMAETDLNEALADVLDLLQPRLEQTCTTVVVAGLLPTMSCNRIRIREVFNNLLTNAMRYNNQPEKRVTIGLAPAAARGPKGTGSPADFYVFAVQDNGIGIAPRHHENIFKLFKRLHAQDQYGGGTGAGLAIARKMVEKHGGELWVDSEAGQGATFLFSLSRHL